MRTYYLYAFLAILLSLFIYIFFRTEKTLVNEIFISLFSVHTYFELKSNIQNTIHLPDLFIYSLPEGLWVFCSTLTSKHYFVELKGKRIGCGYIPLAFAILLELLQYADIRSGTFDLVDIVFSFVFWFIGYYFFIPDTETESIFKEFTFERTICFVSYAIVYLAHVFP